MERQGLCRHHYRQCRKHAVDLRIEEARNAYRAEDYDTAIATLEAVLGELRLRKSNAYERWLPAPPKGWQASRPEAGAAPQPAE